MALAAAAAAVGAVPAVFSPVVSIVAAAVVSMVAVAAVSLGVVRPEYGVLLILQELLLFQVWFSVNDILAPFFY